MMVSVKQLKKIIESFKLFSNYLKFSPSHSAYFLLKNSLSIPRMTYLLRCSPCWRSNDDLIEYDTFLKETLKDICNCSFNENSWSQSALPVSLGGLGFRNLTSLCYFSFVGSIHGVAEL
jgi:hypothetical protein